MRCRDENGLPTDPVHVDTGTRLQVIQVDVTVFGDEKDNILLGTYLERCRGVKWEKHYITLIYLAEVFMQGDIEQGEQGQPVPGRSGVKSLAQGWSHLGIWATESHITPKTQTLHYIEGREKRICNPRSVYFPPMLTVTGILDLTQITSAAEAV